MLVAAITSATCASRCSSAFVNTSKRFSSSTFFRLLFCCSSRIAATNLSCKSSLSSLICYKHLSKTVLFDMLCGFSNILCQLKVYQSNRCCTCNLKRCTLWITKYISKLTPLNRSTELKLIRIYHFMEPYFWPTRLPPIRSFLCKRKLL